LDEYRWETALSDGWIRVSEKIIKQLKQLEETKGIDRLEMVRSLRFVLGVLQRSLVGWTQWVGNPDIMTIFSEDDLQNMTKTLAEFTRTFIEYDLKMTSLGAAKGLKAPKKFTNKKKQNTSEQF
jgi:hypothetical protein